MKRCSTCGETKPLDEFCRHPKARDGRQSRCRACQNAYQREKRATAPDWKRRQYDSIRWYQNRRRATDPEYRERVKAYQREYYRRRKQAEAAQ